MLETDIKLSVRTICASLRTFGEKKAKLRMKGKFENVGFTVIYSKSMKSFNKSVTERKMLFGYIYAKSNKKHNRCK